jgi:LemA protein
MTGGTIALLLVAAVLVFWTVGAYNRLVGLRNQIVALFAPLDEQFRQRHQLLREQAQALAALPGQSAADLDAVHAALSQAEGACAHARMHPGANGAIASLRLAEDVLAVARARLSAQALADPGLIETNARLATAEASLEFTRRRFNEAVAEYNAALGQFPTWLIASLFGFGNAATL